MIYEHEHHEKSRPPTEINTSSPPEPCLEEGAWGRMKDYLWERGISYGLAKQNGCYPTQKRGLRLFLPSKTRIPGHTYWQARSMDGDPLRYDSPSTSRRDALMVYWGELPLKTVVIVEGPMDALAAAMVQGILGIGLMGVTPNDEALVHVAHYLSLQKRPQVLCVADRDQVGGMCQIQSWLAMKGYPSELRVPQDSKDLADMSINEREVFLSGGLDK